MRATFRRTTVFCCMAAIAAFSSPAFGAVALPYADSFETYSVGNLPTGSGVWSKSGTNAEVLVVTDPVLVGNKACTVSDATNLLLDIDEAAGSYTSIWYEVFSKPYRYDDATNNPPIDSTVTGAFYVNTNGTLRAYESDAWGDLATGLPDAWIGFKVYVDYNGGKWDLYYTTNGYGSSWTKANGAAMFTSTGSTNELSEIGFLNSARIDAINIYAVSVGGVGLPFFDGFEVGDGHTLGASPGAVSWWSVTGSGSAQVTNTPVRQGVQACNINGTDLALDLDASKGHYSNVWCRLYLQTGGYDDSGETSPPDVDAEAVAVCYVNTAGVMRACVEMGGTNGWTNILTSVPLDTWFGLALHLDYNTDKWDVYYSTGAYEAQMQKVNTSPLAFCTNGSASTEMTALVVENEAELDAVALAIGLSPVDGSSGTNLMTKSYTGGGTNPFSIVNYSYGLGDSTLDGKLGMDLAQALDSGDEIWVFYTNGWQIYELQIDVWVRKSDIAVSNMPIRSSMGLLLKRLNATNAVSFIAYDSVTNSPNPVLSGTNSTEMVGWNLLAWSGGAKNANDGWGFDGKLSGDMIYVYRPGKRVLLHWNQSLNGGLGKWREGPVESNYLMQKDQVFWYRSMSNTNWVWDVPLVP